jgi:hypothetical protein
MSLRHGPSARMPQERPAPDRRPEVIYAAGEFEHFAIGQGLLTARALRIRGRRRSRDPEDGE